MSNSEPADKKHTSSSFDWTIGARIRDGRYGPVFLGLRTDTAELISAEEFTPQDEPGTASALESVVAFLGSRLARPSQPNIISCLGYELKEGRIFILTEYLPGGTVRDLTRSYGAIPQPLARTILRQVVLGLEQLQNQDISPVFLDLGIVMVDNVCAVKIEAPLLDVTAKTGNALPSTADVWLLGVLAAQLLTGDCSLAEAGAAGSVAERIKESQASALELLIPGDVASKLDRQASDLIRQCLSIDTNHRPSVSDLLEHPFLSGVA
ncbi:hypothetical protein INS49_013944 [Diaporthe citri]|uniref:uncharacterized protein n=1 Tax=Diaporthe citri TaxID=83186 RepID=UPI001C7F27E9|nr:uncharacterized protein INS49_013944 [Diaporthe citri]KAG6358060.1 hypothetical protein INS49_013944 [Diaporthe citri]